MAEPKPIDPNWKESGSVGKPLPDENAWLWYASKEIEEAIIKASAPLHDYVKTFKQFEDDEHKLNPDQYIKKLEEPDEGEPLDAQGLMADIERLRELQKELRVKIPDSVTVSIFKVITQDIWNNYNQKYEAIIEKEKKLIAEAAISANFAMSAKFDALNAEIMRPPTDIEDLMRIKDYIQNSATELQKLQQ
jgi:5'-deoxynucleotidase YfbR-like HD superfamily hydrolase